MKMLRSCLGAIAVFGLAMICQPLTTAEKVVDFGNKVLKTALLEVVDFAASSVWNKVLPYGVVLYAQRLMGTPPGTIMSAYVEKDGRPTNRTFAYHLAWNSIWRPPTTAFV